MKKGGGGRLYLTEFQPPFFSAAASSDDSRVIMAYPLSLARGRVNKKTDLIPQPSMDDDPYLDLRCRLDAKSLCH
jgi:hypothetical protein